MGWDYTNLSFCHPNWPGKVWNRMLALYYNLYIRVKVNNHLLDAFQIQNVTKQGFSLSLIILVEMLEPFLCMIRRNPDSQGFLIKDKMYKITLFTKDIPFSLTASLITTQSDGSLQKLWWLFKFSNKLF